MPSLYVHVPFCRRKCPYCDFFSVPASERGLSTYPDLLVRQMEIARERGWSGPFATIFFGGGTPSLLPPAAVAKVICAAADLFGIEPGGEITLEANPGTLDEKRLFGYREAGVNRLSLGVQSLNEDDLKLLGRIHSPGESRDAVRWGRAAGFAGISCDLIFALPGQTLPRLREETERLLALEPDHLSCYGLTVEEGTPFHPLHCRGELPLPDEDEFARQFLGLHALLEGAGYRHYEISNYARPGSECRHNERYWRRRGYLGIGPAGHSFCSLGWGSRSASAPDLGAWEGALRRGEDPLEELESFDRQGAMSETLYLGLRTADGVAEDDFRGRFGLGVEEAFPQEMASLQGRLRREGGRWRFGAEDWLLYDTLICAFL